MDGQALRDGVAADCDAELSRLASDKVLLAITGADIDDGPVLGFVAATERARADLAGNWSDAAAAFGEIAARASDHVERVHEDAAGDLPADAESWLPAAEADDAVAAAGWLLGAALVLDGAYLQGISYFVNEADEFRSDLLRDVRRAVDDDGDAAAAALETLCADDDDCERARTAAEGVVTGTYERYVDRLEEMGLDPRPVC
ncbi:MAG: rubrerythrin family protein [Haloarculaceae archaeon]